ncbi:MAG: HlyD family efflux transporter periplasmic adaptor subunit [Chloroflexia bacterium]
MKQIERREIEPATNGADHANGVDDGSAATLAISRPPVAGAHTPDPRALDDSDLVLRPPRRSRWRVIVPIFLLLAVAVGVAYYFLRPQAGAPMATVRVGTIISTVETTGKLEAERSAKLSFKASGRVDKVIAKQGDTVKAGDVLAELDTSLLQRQLNEARVQLDISKLKLQQAKEGAKPADIAAATADLNGAVAALNQVRSGGRAEDIAAAQAQVNQAQAKLDGLKKGASAQDIASAEAAVRAAQAKLDAARQPATAQQISEAEAAVREAQAKLASVKAGPTAQDIAAAQAGVDQAQATLAQVKAPASAEDISAAQAKVDQAKANRTQISATASNAKEQARIAMDQAANQMRNAQDAYAKIRDDNAQTNPKNLTDDQKQAEARALRDLQDAQGKLAQAQLAYEAAKQNEIAQLNAADAQVNEAQSALDKLKAGPTAQDIAVAQAGVDAAKAKLAQVRAGPKAEDVTAAQAGVDQAQARLDSLKVGGTASDIAAAQAGVDQAKEALAKLKAGATADDLRQAKEAVAQAQANLNKVKAGATPQEIKESQSKVDAAQAALDKVKSGPTATDEAILGEQINLAQISVDNANAQLADARLTSPIDGTVLSIDLDVGEIAGGQQPVAVVADTISLRIKADIDEIDVGRVRAGQPVTVTLDAYPGEKMGGSIEALAPGATLKQGSTVYQATIVFTPTEGVIPREGMAANVDVTAQRKDNALLLPNRAFETVGRREYVTIAENGTTRKVEVETGLTNATDTEVVSGLKEGQQVVLK